jgi:hypothetical protein
MGRSSPVRRACTLATKQGTNLTRYYMLHTDATEFGKGHLAGTAAIAREAGGNA